MFVPLFTAIISGITGIFTDKLKIKRAQVEGQINVMAHAAKTTADWTMLMARGTIKSWKDEYVLILLSAPYIMAFIPGMADYAHRGFVELALMPDWYTYLLVTIFLASYGIKISDTLRAKFLK